MATQARGRSTRTPGEMNGLERAWSLRLEEQRLAGEITAWWFEPMSLRLAKGSSYKPDFMVITKDEYVEFHETKGFFREAAKVRLKVAATKFPQFVFKLVVKVKKKDGGGFDVSEVKV